MPFKGLGVGGGLVRARGRLMTECSRSRSIDKASGPGK